MTQTHHMTNLVASASLLGILTFFGTAVSQVDSNTRIPLGEAIAVGGAVFLIGRKLQKLEDRLASIEEDLKRRPCQLGDCSVKPNDIKK